MAICKNICLKYKVNRKQKGCRYNHNHKYCVECQIFMLWGGVFCPCCGTKLRAKPRAKL